MTDELTRLAAKLDADLAWRGPNAKVLGHIVLPRDLAAWLATRLDEWAAWREEGRALHAAGYPPGVCLMNDGRASVERLCGYLQAVQDAGGNQRDRH